MTKAFSWLTKASFRPPLAACGGVLKKTLTSLFGASFKQSASINFALKRSTIRIPWPSRVWRASSSEADWEVTSTITILITSQRQLLCSITSSPPNLCHVISTIQWTAAKPTTLSYYFSSPPVTSSQYATSCQLVQKTLITTIQTEIPLATLPLFSLLLAFLITSNRSSLNQNIILCNSTLHWTHSSQSITNKIGIQQSNGTN